LLALSLASFVRIPYSLASASAYDKIIKDISNDKTLINTDILKAYKDNFHHAVDSVFTSGSDTPLAQKLKQNLTRFSFYKAYHATSDVRSAKDVKEGKSILNKFNSYQATEYNTAVSRSRTAKQWQAFSSDQEGKDLFPNIQWLPSRSASPREEHMIFYNRIWSKDDPFWNANSPGSLYNCKCDWQETDSPTTEGNPSAKVAAQGLQGNPGKTGDVFSDDAAYFKKVPEVDAAAIDNFANKYIDNTTFAAVKGYKNITQAQSVNPKDSDYSTILKVASNLSNIKNEKAMILPRINNPFSLDYKEIYASHAAKYPSKCPDLKVGEHFYEVEGFDKTKDISNRHVRFKTTSKMINRGLKQSDRIIIEDCDLDDISLLKIIKITPKEINELWVINKKGLRQVPLKTPKG